MNTPKEELFKFYNDVFYSKNPDAKNDREQLMKQKAEEAREQEMEKKAVIKSTQSACCAIF